MRVIWWKLALSQLQKMYGSLKQSAHCSFIIPTHLKLPYDVILASKNNYTLYLFEISIYWNTHKHAHKFFKNFITIKISFIN